MAITRTKKEEIVAELKETLSNAMVIAAADNRGLTVEQMSALRTKGREAGCYIKIAKNTLIQHALEEIGRGEGLFPYLQGPTILATHDEDPVAPAKVFIDFAKENEKLEIKSAVLRDETLDADGVKRLAALPGRDELRSEFAGLVNNLIGVVYFNAENLMSEFSGLLQAQKDKMEQAA